MSSEVFVDHEGRAIRLTNERWQHIINHAEMLDQRNRIVETLTEPDHVIATIADNNIYVYQRFYQQTPVTSKYLLIAVKILEDDAFIVTAFYSRKAKKGDIVWQK